MLATLQDRTPTPPVRITAKNDEVFDRIAAAEALTPDRLAPETSGRRAGWWGMSESTEAFLDQLVTWRELGLNRCLHVDGYDRFEALPAWARRIRFGSDYILDQALFAPFPEALASPADSGKGRAVGRAGR